MNTAPIVVLTGGVGGAKLVLGLTRVVDPKRITAIVNTGDDFRHFGLAVSPDVDTLLYTLAGRADPEKGWGRADESWSFMEAACSLGGEDWFNLGDGDLALHVLRTHQLANGRSLSAIIGDFARAWDVFANILPMSDDLVATMVETDLGEIEFQRYFVEQQCTPVVRSVGFRGAENARPAGGIVEAIAAAEAILIAPSNPYLSIDPILAIAPIADALRQTSAPVVAISPLVGGKAVKGPTAKLMKELGVQVSNASIAAHYKDLIDGMILNDGDDIPNEIATAATSTLMITIEDRERVARSALALARSIAAG